MIFSFIVQVIVCVLIVRWVLTKKTGEKYSKKSITKFFLIGVITTVFSLIFTSLVSLERDTFFGMNPYVGGFLTAFISAAVVEEVVKYIVFRLFVARDKEVICWLDVIIAAIVFGVGFTLAEDLSYAMFGDGHIIRAILPMHILFQLIMGYYYGKACVTKQVKYHILSLLVPILCHTIFDLFPLSMKILLKDEDLTAFRQLSNEELSQSPYFNDMCIMIGGVFVTAIASLVLLIVLLRKVGVWSKNNEKQEEI